MTSINMDSCLHHHVYTTFPFTSDLGSLSLVSDLFKRRSFFLDVIFSMLNCFCCRSADITRSSLSHNDEGQLTGQGRITDLPSKVADSAVKQQKTPAQTCPPKGEQIANNNSIEPIQSQSVKPVDQPHPVDPLHKTLQVEQPIQSEQVRLIDACDNHMVDEDKNDPNAEVNMIIQEISLITKDKENKSESELLEMAAQFEPLLKRFEEALSRFETISSSNKSVTQSQAPSGGATLSAFIAPFDDIIQGPLSKYVSLSKEIGAEVNEQAVQVFKAFQAQKEFLIVVGNSKKPSDAVLQTCLTPTSTSISKVMEYSNSYKSAFKNNLCTICESISALGWVGVSPAPGPFVKEMSDAGQFYSNRVLKEFKETDKKHVDWIKAWKEVFTMLIEYIKVYHTTGLAWNPKGGEAKLTSSPSASSAPTTGGPPPPPGPPPSSAFLTDSSAAKSSSNNARSALFDDLNKGGSVTAGLKKVTSDMKTHKNPELRGSSIVHASATSNSPSKPSLAAKPTAVKPPKCQLEGKKWIIEHQVNNKEITLNDTNPKQTAYIYNCQASVIKVVGKLNSICLDNCKKTSILFDDVISSVDFVNCKSIEMQVIGKVPTINVDKTDGCKIYLSENACGAEIVTAKSSEMNLLLPLDNGEFKEYCIAEQFKTIYKDGKLVTVPTDIAS